MGRGIIFRRWGVDWGGLGCGVGGSIMELGWSVKEGKWPERKRRGCSCYLRDKDALWVLNETETRSYEDSCK